MVAINLLDSRKDIPFSRSMACLRCGVSFPEVNPRLFSFNSTYGACSRCRGIGLSGFNALEEEPGIGAVEELKACGDCGGLRLRREALSVMIQGLNIGEFSKLTVEGALSFVNGLTKFERCSSERRCNVYLSENPQPLKSMASKRRSAKYTIAGLEKRSQYARAGYGRP